MKPARAAAMSTCTIALLAGLAALGLSGCSDAGSGFTVFDRPAEAADALPADFADDPAFERLRRESSRFIADDDGRKLYLVRAEGSNVCLLIHSESDAVLTCGRDHFTVDGPESTYEVFANGNLRSENRTLIGPNVYVVD